MSEFRWDAVKNRRLKRTRGVSFEEILQWTLVAIEKHPQREHQKLMFFERHGYIWVVPCVDDGETIFLKTLFPSRKYSKRYRKGLWR